MTVLIVAAFAALLFVVVVATVCNQLRTDRELAVERAQINARIARVEAINDRLEAQLKRRGR